MDRVACLDLCDSGTLALHQTLLGFRSFSNLRLPTAFPVPLLETFEGLGRNLGTSAHGDYALVGN